VVYIHTHLDSTLSTYLHTYLHIYHMCIDPIFQPASVLFFLLFR
jgi:hypothetical protein